MAKNKFNPAESVNPETIALHGGDYRADPSTTSVAVPIYQTTSYQFHILNMRKFIWSKRFWKYLYQNYESNG